MFNGYILLFCLICIISVSVLNVSFAYNLSFLIDSLINMDQQLFISQILIMITIIGLLLVVEFFSQYLNSIYLNQIGFQIHGTYLSKLLNMNISEFQSKAKGTYLSRIENDIDRVKDLRYGSFLALFQGLVSLFVSSYVLFTFDIITASVILVTTILPVIVPYLFRNVMRNRQNQIVIAQANYSSLLASFLNGIIEIKNLLSHTQVNKYLSDKYQTINHQLNITARLSAFVNVLVGALFYSMTLLILFIGGNRVLKGMLTVGQLTAILSIADELIGPINNIADSLLSIYSVKDLDLPLSKNVESPKKSESDSFNTTTEPFQIIKVENLTHCYQEECIIKDFNQTFEAGKKYLINGASGRGKSTLMNLLTQNLPLQSGTIILNNKPLTDYSYQQIQDMIAYIPQNSHLFEGNVLENIFLSRNQDIKVVNEFLHRFGLKERFHDQVSLNEKMNEDSRLSGGQKQRIVLIRSLIQDKPILILDEGLSALDKKQFGSIERYLTELDGLTLIHISHRISNDANKLYDEVINF